MCSPLTPRSPLQELLAKASLPQSGKKDELIARLLETPSSLETDSPAPEETAPAVEESTPAADVVAAPTVEEVAAPAVVAPTDEEKKAQAEAEEAKRKARSERFGVTEMKGGDEALNKRAERFGLKLDDKKEQAVEKVRFFRVGWAGGEADGRRDGLLIPSSSLPVSRSSRPTSGRAKASRYPCCSRHRRLRCLKSCPSSRRQGCRARKEDRGGGGAQEEACGEVRTGGGGESWLQRD